MNQKISSLLRTLKFEYFLMWFFILLTVIMYETDFLPQGTIVGNARMEYMVQLTGVLLAICFIPMSLRMFGLFITKYVRTLDLERAVKSYRRWSEIRIIMLFVAAFFNISMYYWTMDITGLLCGGMALVASLFCIPDEKKLMTELDLYNENEEDDKDD